MSWLTGTPCYLPVLTLPLVSFPFIGLAQFTTLPLIFSTIFYTRKASEMRAGPLGDLSSLASTFDPDWDNPAGGGDLMTQEGKCSYKNAQLPAKKCRCSLCTSSKSGEHGLRSRDDLILSTFLNLQHISTYRDTNSERWTSNYHNYHAPNTIMSTYMGRLSLLTMKGWSMWLVVLLFRLSTLAFLIIFTIINAYSAMPII
jgi:hypothetical protein